MNGRLIPRLALFALLFNAGVARADEIRLKDGTKITGTIVGFENDAFRVETSYGFALILKDKVADINITAPKKEPEPKAKPNTSSAQPTAAPPAVAPAVAKESPSSADTRAPVNTPANERPPAATNASSIAAKNEPAFAKVKTAPATSPTPPVPPPPAEPPTIHDKILGNLYVNETYGFQMYKPPSWDLVPSARKALPDAVAALGTSDQTTLLVIGRERAKDPLAMHAAAMEKALSAAYENYRLISSRQITVAGLPAVEQRSRGTAEGRDWSVLLLTLVRGNDAYTLLGMTWADSDLIQVQENVIAKTVSSLTFTSQ